MRAIVIDPKAREVREENFEGDTLEYLHKTIAPLVCVVRITPIDDVWVDDEGLLNGTQEFFYHPNYPQPLAGMGVILGHDKEGNTVSTNLDIEKVRGVVEFLDIHQAIEKMR